MLKLVIKDILIQKKTFIMCIFYSLFAVVVFSQPFESGGPYIFGTISIVYLLTFYANSYDDKNKCEVVLNSLPIRRTDIVVAKYLPVLLYSVIGIVLMGIAGLLLKDIGIPLDIRIMNLDDIILCFIAVMLMFSIFYPFYFRFGLMKLKLINMILYLAFAFGPSMLLPNLNKQDIRWANGIFNTSMEFPGQILLLLAVLCILMLSISLSFSFYKKREFN
jgi:hypothetical protein